jgi:SMP-30/Gluconolactonase/LRE-like region
MAGIADFHIAPGELGFVGLGLNRPECVLCTQSGDIYVSRWGEDGGGVTRIAADGAQQDILGRGAPLGSNGFAITAEGDFLVANLHSEANGAWRLRRDGSAEPFLNEIDGTSLPSANFVGVDRQGRVWITFSTWLKPRFLAYHPGIADGFIILVDARGPRIVADGIGYTNEAVVDPSGQWLYVNETMGRRTIRFPIRDGGRLGIRETVAEYGYGVYPDGLAFDAEGGVWMTSVLSNRLIRIAPDGSQSVVLEENDAAELERIEQLYLAGDLDHATMNSVPAGVMKSISSLAFGGPDRRTVYLGNLKDERLYSFRSPVAGAEPAHWRFTW